MKKVKLVRRVSERLSKVKAYKSLDVEFIHSLVSACVTGTFEEILEALQHGEQVSIFRFGRFYPYFSEPKRIVCNLKSHYGRNDLDPNYVVPQRNKMKFKASKIAERKLNSLSTFVRKVNQEATKKVRHG